MGRFSKKYSWIHLISGSRHLALTHLASKEQRCAIDFFYYVHLALWCVWLCVLDSVCVQLVIFRDTFINCVFSVLLFGDPVRRCGLLLWVCMCLLSTEKVFIDWQILIWFIHLGYFYLGWSKFHLEILTEMITVKLKQTT